MSMKLPDDGNWDGDETAIMGCGIVIALVVSFVAAAIVSAVLS